MSTPTYEKIQHIELSSSSSNITFSSIPATFTDLYLVVSARSSAGGGTKGLEIGFNGAFTNVTNRVLAGSGSSASSFTSTQYLGQLSIPADTSNTFSSHAVYIPNYLSSTSKAYSSDSVSENNGTAAWQIINAGLWSGTAAITQISLRGEGGTNLEAYSSATLYGIKSAALLAKATGGVIQAINGYWYHTFTSSGTFTPTTTITNADYIVIGGGGGGASGNDTAVGGGGSGYLQKAAGVTISTAQTVTIGAGGGGSKGAFGGNGATGNATVFGAVTANGGVGGSNGGGGGAGGSGGGNDSGGSNGSNGTGTLPGAGSGVTLPSWQTPGAGGGRHQAGGFYAGGGGLSSDVTDGGNGATGSGAGGGAGGRNSTNRGGNGGSGIVIVRYPF